MTPPARPRRRHRVHAGHDHPNTTEAKKRCTADYNRAVAYARVDLLIARLRHRDDPTPDTEAAITAAETAYTTITTQP